MGKIRFDFLTFTSKKATLRAFFFFLVKKAPFRFTLRSKFMQIGGPLAKFLLVSDGILGGMNIL